MTEQPALAARTLVFLRKSGGHIAIELMVNFILPFLIYIYTQQPLGDVRALVASSAPPILWSLVEFARHRRIDALSLLVLAGILLSTLAVLGGGSVRFLQLREKLVTAAIGLIFLGSIVVRRPLIYELARANMLRKSKAEAQEFAALLAHPDFRRTVTIMTVVVGVGLLVDAAFSVLLVLTLSIRDYLIFGPILGYAWLGGLALWVMVYGQWAKRRSEARRVAEDTQGIDLSAGAAEG
jgi:hypothetical protein